MYVDFTSELLLIPIATLSGMVVVFWILFKLIGNKKRGLATLSAMVVWPLLTVFNPAIIIYSALPLILGYLVGRSTKIPADPTDTFSKEVEVTEEIYVSRMENMVHYMLSPIGTKYFYSPKVHWTQKLSYVFHVFRYLLIFKKAPAVALSMASVFSLFLSLFGFSQPISLFGGFLLGISIGNLTRFVQAQPPKRKYRVA